MARRSFASVGGMISVSLVGVGVGERDLWRERKAAGAGLVRACRFICRCDCLLGRSVGSCGQIQRLGPVLPLRVDYMGMVPVGIRFAGSETEAAPEKAAAKAKPVLLTEPADRNGVRAAAAVGPEPTIRPVRPSVIS